MADVMFAGAILRLLEGVTVEALFSKTELPERQGKNWCRKKKKAGGDSS